jgi:hypothetical protein
VIVTVQSPVKAGATLVCEPFSLGMQPELEA